MQNNNSCLNAQNMTLLNQKIQGYNSNYDHSRIDFKKGDNTQYGEIKIINRLLGQVSCFVNGVWYNERDLIPVAKNAAPVNSTNSFFASLLTALING